MEKLNLEGKEFKFSEDVYVKYQQPEMLKNILIKFCVAVGLFCIGYLFPTDIVSAVNMLGKTCSMLIFLLIFITVLEFYTKNKKEAESNKVFIEDGKLQMVIFGIYDIKEKSFEMRSHHLIVQNVTEYVLNKSNIVIKGQIDGFFHNQENEKEETYKKMEEFVLPITFENSNELLKFLDCEIEKNNKC